MANDYFHFKQFTLNQGRCAFKVGTDGVILGAHAEVRDVNSILDVGSGTGLLAIMLAQRSNAVIYAIEPDNESFLQMSENVAACKWSNRINVINTRLQDYQPGIRFDLIVSNPPYFTGSLRNPDARKSGTRHDDTLTQKDLLEYASHLLTETGKFQVIMPAPEGTRLITEAERHGLFCEEILKIRTLPSSVVRRMVITFVRSRGAFIEKSLIIGDGRKNTFTEEYKSLTGEFYLSL